MTKLKLLSRNSKKNIEIYQCSCCHKVRVDIAPLSITLEKKSFSRFAQFMQKALEEFDDGAEMDSRKKVCFELGPNAMLSLGFNDLCELGLCLVTAEERLNALEKAAGFSDYFHAVSLN